jgi:hypothetical protein
VAEATTTLGGQFARALTEKDFERAGELLHPEVDFRALTPSRFWEASSRDAVVADILPQWLEPEDNVESLDSVETDQVGDRERVGYRFTVANPDGRFVVEQQAYVSERDGRIDWIRIVCSGFRPVA